MKATYSGISEDIDTSFGLIYQHAVRMAAAVDVVPSMPRVNGRQTNRANAPSSNPEDHYRINTAVDFVNHIRTQLDAKFGGKTVTFIILTPTVPGLTSFT